MSKRSPMLIVWLRALLIEVFKCVRELDPIFMNILFTLNNKPYDTRSGSLITQSQVKTIKHGINSFVYQGGKQWNELPADAKDIEDLNVFNKANLRDLIAATSLVFSNWIQIVNFSTRVTVKFDGWPCKTIGHLSYAISSFVHHFIPIGEFNLDLQSGNAKFGSNSTIFRAVRPWNLTDDLAKQ